MTEESDRTRIAVLEERIRGMSTALSLQAEKYEARLQDLNHAHDKQVADQGTYVSKEKYEQFVEEVRQTLAELKGRTSGIKSTWTAIVAAIALLLSLLQYLRH
jgi:cell division protein ZapA (FtsZ GTPase activity inhibitor)